MKCILANPGRSSTAPHLGAGYTFPAMNLAIPKIKPMTSPDKAPAEVSPGHRIPSPNTMVIGGAR